MRPLTGKTHLAAACAATAAAVFTAFALPMPAHADTTIVMGEGKGPLVIGSGKAVAQERRIDAFTDLRMEGSLDVQAHPGATNTVVVHADDNVEPMIETKVEDGVLVVRFRKGTSFQTKTKTYVELQFTALSKTRQLGSGDLHITSLTGTALNAGIAGSGDLKIDDARLERFAVDIAGSGDVTIAGSTQEAKYSVAGSGDIHARKFEARRVDVSINGSGDADVYASEAIDARVSGSGDVNYRGHPRDVNRRVSGSGSVSAD